MPSPFVGLGDDPTSRCKRTPPPFLRAKFR